MIYFIDDQFFREYQQERAWLCFPVKNKEEVEKRDGLGGKVLLQDGTRQLMVCYPSLPMENDMRNKGSNSLKEEVLINHKRDQTPEILGTKVIAEEQKEEKVEQPVDRLKLTPKAPQKKTVKQKETPASPTKSQKDESIVVKAPKEPEQSNLDKKPEKIKKDSPVVNTDKNQNKNTRIPNDSRVQQGTESTPAGWEQNTMPTPTWMCQKCGRHWVYPQPYYPAHMNNFGI